MSCYKIRPLLATLLLMIFASGCAVPTIAASASVPPVSSEAIVQRTEPLPKPTDEELQQSLEGKLPPLPLLLSAGVHKQTADQKAEAEKIAAEEAAAQKAAADKKAAEEAAAKKAAADKKAAEEAAQKEQSGASEPEDTGSEGESENDTPESETPEGDLPATGSSGSSSLVKNGKIAVSDLRSVANEPHYNIAQAFLDDISGRDSLSVSEFKSLAASHGLSQKYVQRFVDDAFVYKVGNTYKYTPVDFSLRMHSYNFDNLTHNGSYKDYVVGGQSRAEVVIDVSYAQGDINWNSVKSSGINKAYIRLGRRAGVTGLLGLDDKFHQNMRGAQAAGVQVGVYFYTQAVNNAEAREEANFVLDALSGYTLDLPVVFDIEGGENAQFRAYSLGVQTATNVCITFLDTIKSAGHPVMLYSYAKYASEHLDLSQLQQYDFWLAQYYDVPFFPYNFKMWQYSGSGSVPGIKGGVDMNLLFTDYRK